MFDNISVQTRVLCLLGLMLISIAGAMVLSSRAMDEIADIGVAETQNTMLQGERNKIKVATDAMAAALGDLLKDIPGDEARVEFIRKSVDSFRFEADQSGYFFVYKGTVNVALPPKKELQGKDLNETKDVNGVYFVRDLAKAAAAGGGFVEYVFLKPGKGDQPKLAYAALIPGTDIWIGTGIYIDNVEEAKTAIRTHIATAAGKALRSITLQLAAFFIILVLPLAVLLIRSVVLPIKEATAAAQAVAAGNLDITITPKGTSEMGRLQTALRDMVTTLKKNLEDITLQTRLAEEKAAAAEHASEEARAATARAERAKAEGMLHAASRLDQLTSRLAAAMEEIAAQSDIIRQSTTQQQERIHSTATGMEEMRATVVEVARSAAEAARQSTQAQDEANRGAEVVGKSIQAMDTTRKKAEFLKDSMRNLDQQAKEIGSILTTINDIADQTNLLALNAAIEAARAGDAGRGFAVVADEVRKLAEKTMQATREVGQSITAIQNAAASNVAGMEEAVQEMGRAADMANESGASLSAIVQAAQTAAGQVHSIATAAEEQSATTEEFSRALEEINQLAEETATHIAGTAEVLHELAEPSTLTALIDTMKRESQAQ
ncbi:MAG: methyl-accepting chemotaxis protein [Desulfovibrio sp.]|nr:methyl-accepting chemotaxis protein [Desulfovibrio sp.]